MHPHATASAEHGYPVPGADSRPLPDVHGGDEGIGDDGGADGIEVLGQGHEVPGREADLLSQGPGPVDAEHTLERLAEGFLTCEAAQAEAAEEIEVRGHPLAQPAGGHAGSHAADRSDQLVARNEGQEPGIVTEVAPEHVAGCEAHGTRQDVDQDFPRAGLRVRELDERRWFGETPRLDGLHHSPSGSW